MAPMVKYNRKKIREKWRGCLVIAGVILGASQKQRYSRATRLRLEADKYTQLTFPSKAMISAS